MSKCHCTRNLNSPCPGNISSLSAAVFHLLLLPLKEIFQVVFLWACRIFQVSWNVINYSCLRNSSLPAKSTEQKLQLWRNLEYTLALVKHLIIVRCFSCPSTEKILRYRRHRPIAIFYDGAKVFFLNLRTRKRIFQ